MNPLRLTATNLRTFPAVDWQIPEGITAIIGPNGAGKSTLLGAVELALFADGARDLAPALGPFAASLEITLEFEHAGEMLRVRRTYSGSGRGKATLDFEQRHEYLPKHEGDTGFYDWHPLTRESASATQTFLEDTLGLSRQTFGASAYIAQGNSAAFCEAAPAERKSILGAILDPAQIWPRLANKALAERKIAETELQVAQTKAADREPIAAQADDLDRAAAQAGVTVGVAEAAHTEAAEALGHAQAARVGNEAAAERWRSAEQAERSAKGAVDAAQKRLADAQADADQLPHAQAALAELDRQAAEIPALQRKAEEARTAELRAQAARQQKADAHAAVARQDALVADLSREAALLRTRAAAAQDKLNHLAGAEAGAERCDRCEQILGAEALAAAERSLAAEAEQLRGEREAKEASVDEAQRLRAKLAEDAVAIEVPVLAPDDSAERLEQARRAAQERAGLAVRLQAYEAADQQLPALSQAHIAAERDLLTAHAAANRSRDAMADPAVLEQAVAAASFTASNRRVDAEEARANLIRAQEALARARDAQTELNQLRERAAELNALLALLRLAERATGRDGIPALIAENTCGIIEAEANRVLEQLPTASGTTFRVELRTQRALKTDAAALRETLDILVSDRQTTREFLTFSGGEQFRVSFALRWALARLLAGRRGAESRLLVVDEPDGLDAGGMDGLAAVLREGAVGFDRVLLVSHNPLLASAFPQVAEVASDGEASWLVGDREGVTV